MATQVNWVSVTFIVKNLTSPCYNQNLFLFFSTDQFMDLTLNILAVKV